MTDGGDDYDTRMTMASVQHTHTYSTQTSKGKGHPHNSLEYKENFLRCLILDKKSIGVKFKEGMII
jgi:hypothetical protein